LLGADPIKLVSELNKDEFHRAVSCPVFVSLSLCCNGWRGLWCFLSYLQWDTVSGLSKHYHGAAIQTFTHLKHEDYACQGPYIKKWMEGAASWHPSVIAHRLRASHHAYFWLLIWQEALQELMKNLANNRNPDALLKDTSAHLDKLYIPMKEAVNKLPFLDDMKCYTNYEPRAVREVSLKDRVLTGLSTGTGEKGTYTRHCPLLDTFH
jgi:hypothetical protein